MRPWAPSLLAGAGLLAACGNEPSPGSAEEEVPEFARSEAAISPEPVETEPSADPAPSPEPEASETDSPEPEPTLFNLPEVPAQDVAQNRAELTAIPARFLGRWDAPDGPCSPRSEMFVTIRPGTIRFAESLGKVTGVRRGRPGIVVTLAMEGEGERWTRDYAMNLVENSERLAMRDLSGEGSGAVRQRCPAERPAPAP